MIPPFSRPAQWTVTGSTGFDVMPESSVDKALMLREQGLFKAMLRDMREEEIKVALATRKWIDYSSRNQLSWREVLARSELERRQSRAPDVRQLILLETELLSTKIELKRARVHTLIAISAAVVALLMPVSLWLKSGIQMLELNAGPALTWLTQVAPTLLQRVIGQ